MVGTETQSACPNSRRMDILYFPMALHQLALAYDRARMLLAVYFARCLIPELLCRHSAQLVSNPVRAAKSIYNIDSHCQKRKRRPAQGRRLVSDTERELEWPSCLETSERYPQDQGRYQTNKPSS